MNITGPLKNNMLNQIEITLVTKHKECGVDDYFKQKKTPENFA